MHSLQGKNMLLA